MILIGTPIEDMSLSMQDLIEGWNDKPTTA